MFSFNDVVGAIVGNDFSREGKRFEALLSRLKRTVTIISENIVEEFRNSDFRPRFFELEIGKNSARPCTSPNIIASKKFNF